MPEASVEELAAFQSALFELLDEGLPLEGVVERLRSDAAFGPFADYVRRFEPRMVEVAALLVAKWGRRQGEAADCPAAER
jgi:hypothetical protein